MRAIFQQITFAFGNLMKNRWEGLDMNDVHEDWIKELSGFTIGALRYALKQSKLKEYPPSQGEFREFCRTAGRFDKPVDQSFRLEDNHKPTFNIDPKEKLAELKLMLKDKPFAHLVTKQIEKGIKE